MKKTTLNLIIFAATLLFSIGLMTSLYNKNPSVYFGKEITFKNKVKVYNFLLADKTRYSEYNNKSLDLRLQPRQDALKILVKEREILIKTLRNERVNTDTNDLPDDFRKAWIKAAIAQKNATEMFYQVIDSKMKSDLLHESGRESMSAAEELKEVVRSYGFEIGDDQTIIE